MRRVHPAWVLTLLVLYGPIASDALRWRPVTGYAKQFGSVFNSPLRIGTDALLTGRLRLNSGASHGRFDLEVGIDIVPRLRSSIDALDSGLPEPEGSAYRLTDIRQRLLPRDGSGQLELFQNIDRLALGIRLGRADLRIGRQPLAFGDALVVNATDVIAPFTYQVIDKEERTGVDAVRLRWALGELSEADVGWVVGDGGRLDDSAGFARLRLYVLDTDVTPMAILFQQHHLLGLSLTRNVWGASTYLEMAQVFAEEGSDYTRWSIGSQQTVHPQLHSLIEFHHNGAGRNRIDPDAGVPHPSAYRDAGVYLLARDYLIPSVVWQMSALSTLSLQALMNLHDGSWLAGPRVEFSLRDDLIAEAGLFKGFAALPTVTRHDDPEFVLYGHTFFADIRRYF
ncbi:MAG: hypothetical protein HN712_03240 [Gemmatimonadetes bacterium]|nr:hypothetical protein [Gemmatimonadota bacterium]MBT6147410.1 hypothetical protein [Gemmatimonadota bacterium]MBT7859293.1 hypothetical protein [Gemmatimonadota bacterium]